MATLPPALANPDILHQIFEELTLYQPCQRSSDYPRIIEGLLDRPSDINIRSRTLVSAALVCKTFSEPASRALWAVLYEGVGPLFRAFSAFKVVKVVDRTNQNHTWLRKFNQGSPETYRTKFEWDESSVPTETERARFTHLASRVRCFLYGRNNGRWIRPPYSTLLFESTANGNSLFPNIQILHFPALHDYDQEKVFFRTLLSPTLEAYSIPHHPKTNTDTLDEILAQIAVVCRHLQYIHIHSQSWSNSALDISLKGFQSLRSVHIGLTSSCGSVLRMLHSLVHLESLQVTFHDDSGSNGPLQSLPSVNLPMLHVLRIDGVRRHTLRQLISSLTAPLTTVHAYITDGCSCSDVTQLMNTLCAPRNIISLHALSLSFTIIGGWEGSTERNRPGSFLELVAPLLRLHSLTSLTVHVSLQPVPGGAIQYTSIDDMHTLHSPLAMDDFSTETMAHAWPQLRHLALTHASSFPRYNLAPVGTSIVRPSISALVKLAQACPALEALTMQVADVDQNGLESLEEQVRADFGQQTALMDLYLEPDWLVKPDEPRVADIDRLATVLHRLFPRLRGRKPQPPPSAANPWIRPYSEVDRLLEKLYTLSIDTSAA